MCVWLHLLTESTTSDVISNVSGHGGPPIVTLQKVKGFEAARVTGSRVIVMEFKKRFTRFGGNICTVAEIENTVSDTPIAEFGTRWWRGETPNSLGCKLHEGFINGGGKAKCFGEVKIY